MIAPEYSVSQTAPLALPVALAAEISDSTVCTSPSRRRLTAQRGLFGIDTVEAEGTNLCVRFFGDIPDNLTHENIRIEGGRRIRDLRIVSVELRPSNNPDLDSCLSITVDREGDFSPYTVKIGDNKDGVLRVRDGFDPRYCAATFLFHPDCPRDTDCATVAPCPPTERVEPLLDYRAKDYSSFRRLLLDRWSLIMPQWRERHIPDIGIVLAEILAYVGDYLSYYQDAVATEAYLETARQRISVRRHARLIDYVLHEGNNARVLISIEADNNADLQPEEFYFATLSPEMLRSGRTVFAQEEVENLLPTLTVFETMGNVPVRIRAAHNRIRFYTWGDTECHLPKGATSATLWDANPSTPDTGSDNNKIRVLDLRSGDLLILEEECGPHTGNRADADPAHRHPVRLTQVTAGYDPLLGENVIEIEWAATDALPFALCLSSRKEPSTPVEGQNLTPCLLLDDISVVRGNVLLADHGRRVEDHLGTVAVGETKYVCRCDGSIADEERLPALFAPTLPRSPLTHAGPMPRNDAPAAVLLTQRPYFALPQIALASARETGERIVRDTWRSRRDLLESSPHDTHFCVETDNDGQAHLRFGDDRAGKQPRERTTFTAHYRIGNGTHGNIGAEALCAVIFRQKRDGLTLRPRNPLPAQGGIEPEPIAQAKLFAPDAFRAERRRAIIPDDFTYFAQQDNRVQRAVSALRWTGSWFESRTAIDVLDSRPNVAGEAMDRAILGDIEKVFARVRRMGWDAVAVTASRVPIALTIFVCVRPEYVSAQVAAMLKSRFSSGVLPDGTRGFFHPDNLTFGQGIAVSRIIAVAQSVPGVLSTEVTELSRQNEPSWGEIEEGILRLASDEVAELTDDPNQPERGLLRVITRGGR